MERKRLYVTVIQKDKNGLAKRKTSAIAEYGITVSDASAVDVIYEDKVQAKLAKIIDAATKSAVARQNLMTAQQQAQTAKAEGEQKLVEIEYQQKQEQTKLVVAAETKVKVAEQDKLQQKIQAEAATLEAMKIKTLADANAYEKQRSMQADGALDKKLAAWLKAEEYKWSAFGQFKGSLTPQVQTGGGATTNGLNFMELMSAKAAKDLALDLKPGQE